MANSTPAGMGFFYDDGAGTPVDITAHILNINDIDVESITEETHPFGQAWEAHKPIGLGRMPPIEFGGLYETASGGPDALFRGRAPETPASATRTFKAVWIASTRETAVETYLLSYRRSPDRNGLTKYTVRLQPTGAVTETAS